LRIFKEDLELIPEWPFDTESSVKNIENLREKETLEDGVKWRRRRAFFDAAFKQLKEAEWDPEEDRKLLPEWDPEAE